MKDQRLADYQTIRAALNDLDRLKVAFAHNLEEHVEPPNESLIYRAFEALRRIGERDVKEG